MERLFPYLARRFEPRVGWPLALLLLCAAGCPSLAAQGAALRLPVGLVFWTGMLGAALGLRWGGRVSRGWGALYALAALIVGATLLVAAGNGLPPAGLMWQDGFALARKLVAWLRGDDPEAAQLLSVSFLRLALPRYWRELMAAPGGGTAGAALIVGTAAVASTWAGGLALGWACGAGRRVLAWSLPLVGALGLTTILGGAGGDGLVMGLGVVMALALLAAHAARERVWERGGFGYSEELRWGALGWGSLAAAASLLVALIVPTSLPRLPVSIPASEGLPSGLAAIEQNVERSSGPREVDPGLSRLPAVSLGVSLSEAPPERMALRIRVGAALAPAPWPRYWRARVLNSYTGRGWTTNARRGPLNLALAEGERPAGALAQEVEVLARNLAALPALPDVLGLDSPAVAERLPDGALAAITPGSELRRYTVVSRPQELAPPLVVTGPEAPYGAESLALPQGLPPRVSELARSITAGTGDQRAAALAIEAYLRGLPYAYEVQPIPGGGDAVDQFLFDMRHGYCTYYASAMAVMARSLGIPARMAVGYATGEYDAETGAYLVREADAHAWPELLIGGRWLPFEPTPVRPLPARGEPGEEPAPLPAPAPLPEAPAPAPLPWPWLAATGGAVVLAGAGGWLLLRRGAASPEARAQLRLERLGARAGVSWPAGATLHEYAGLLRAAGLGPPERLVELVELVEAARYGGRPLSGAELRRLGEAASALQAPQGKQRQGRGP